MHRLLSIAVLSRRGLLYRYDKPVEFTVPEPYVDEEGTPYVLWKALSAGIDRYPYYAQLCVKNHAPSLWYTSGLRAAGNDAARRYMLRYDLTNYQVEGTP